MQFIYAIEDEIHCLMNCTAYTHLFNKCIAPHISDLISFFENFVEFIQSEETNLYKRRCMLYSVYTKHLFSESKS